MEEQLIDYYTGFRGEIPVIDYYKKDKECCICMDNNQDMIFNCGHGTCSVCSPQLQNCPFCRQQINFRKKKSELKVEKKAPEKQSPKKIITTLFFI